MKIKLFFEDLAIVKYPYAYNRYCVDMGVLTFENEKEARDYVAQFRVENPNNTRRFFIIEYKKRYNHRQVVSAHQSVLWKRSMFIRA